MKDTYTIGIPELLARPIIRSDKPEEWENKLTDEEFTQWESEVYKSIYSIKFSDKNSEYISKHIDRTILYNLLKNTINEDYKQI